MPFGLSSPVAAWLALLLVPLVLFYFLKLKRVRVEIPSLALWQQVLNDSRVNSPFQRFKRNILLLLQVLLLLLIVLAATQPYWRRAASASNRRAILIDCSASMEARNPDTGLTRLQAATRQVESLVDNLVRGQQLSIITFGRSARRIAGFTDNKRVLKAALDGVQVAHVPSNIEDALRMAEALNRTTPLEEVVLYTDGNIPPPTQFDLPYRIRYERLEPAGPNIGITELNARRNGRDLWSVFVRVEGSGEEPRGAILRIMEGDTVIGEKILTVSAGLPERLVFSVEGDRLTTIRAQLDPDGFDAMASDNTAYLELPRLRPVVVYARPGLSAFRHALGTIPDVLLLPAESDSTAPPPENIDALISSEARDLDTPVSTALFVGIVPPSLTAAIPINEGNATVVDWDYESPLLQHVVLSDLYVGGQPTYADGIGEREIETAGFTVQVHGDRGPLMLEKRTPGRARWYLLFAPDRSTLPYRVGFPVMISNFVTEAMKESGLYEVNGRSTGVLRGITGPPEQAAKIVTPTGSTVESMTDATGELAPVTAPHAGYYQVRIGTGPEVQVGAALLSGMETRLVGLEKLQFSELAVEAASGTVKSDIPLWSILALLALALLVIEWWIYARRPGPFQRRQAP